MKNDKSIADKIIYSLIIFVIVTVVAILTKEKWVSIGYTIILAIFPNEIRGFLDKVIHSKWIILVLFVVLCCLTWGFKRFFPIKISDKKETTPSTSTIALEDEKAEDDGTEQPITTAPTTAVEYGIGDIISFGSYEQDDNIENGSEILKWEVIDKKDNGILIITTVAIDCQPYNATKTDVTWESCSLRKWLNGTFFSAAFSQKEQDRVLDTCVTADNNPQYGTNPGADTYDKVFALSLCEVEQYFPSDSSRQCSPTAYTVSNGAYKNGNGYCWWWLRSPGITPHDAASVDSTGIIDYDDGRVDSPRGAVRPAMWISLEQ